MRGTGLRLSPPDSPDSKRKGHTAHPILGDYAIHVTSTLARVRRFGLLRTCLLSLFLVVFVLFYSMKNGALFEVHLNSRRLRGFGTAPIEIGPDSKTCVGFQRTQWCSWLGMVHKTEPCSTVIERGSGYCLCGNRMTTKHITCGKHFFKCEEECKDLEAPNSGLALPSPIVCQAADSVLPPMRDLQPKTGDVDVFALDKVTQLLWDNIDVAYTENTKQTVLPPGERTDQKDWVIEGVRMSHSSVAMAKAQWQGFLKAAPAYPRDTFQGRGIVMIGGGMRYMMPAWVSVHMIRRSGCTLPIEMFFPVTEFPSVEMERYLSTLGVDCRKLQMRNLDQKGFSIKVVGMLLSRFQEVIFLDSDNVPLRDVAFLFETPEYQSKGVLVWKDYWDSTAAPDLKRVLGISVLAKGSFESGQMVFDKQKAWRGLLLAHFINMQHKLYYELLSNFMGKGDKETFVAAFIAVGQSYHTIATPPGSIGNMRSVCIHDGEECHDQFFGNTMTQFDPSGKVLFLHTNLSPKWNVNIPDDFDKYYTRRWEVLQPGDRHWVEYSTTNFGEDLERVIYGILRRMYCAPFFASYETQRLRMGDENFWHSTGFHNVIEGIDFVQAFRHGFSGNFRNLISVNTKDSVQHYSTLYIHPHDSEIKQISNLLKPLTHTVPKTLPRAAPMSTRP